MKLISDHYLPSDVACHGFTGFHNLGTEPASTLFRCHGTMQRPFEPFQNK
jgi:hypothetical protein